MNNLKRSRLFLLTASLLFSFTMSSCSEFGKGFYAYKLKQGRKNLEKKFPYIKLKMVVDQEGNYKLYSTQTGLIKAFQIKPSNQGDTVNVYLSPDYDYLEEKLYHFGVNQAKKAKKKWEDRKKTKLP
ncbi:hypothetical protein [uncultured Microscilla sp.]|uniref:hypothetical protein n=1 Tax=uncultured Microscilla sp. TaxID=432653 RepID=UPI002634C134|nr:hypothetical protein [uncultured Microscilla sp.]